MTTHFKPATNQIGLAVAVFSLQQTSQDLGKWQNSHKNILPLKCYKLRNTGIILRVKYYIT